MRSSIRRGLFFLALATLFLFAAGDSNKSMAVPATNLMLCESYHYMEIQSEGNLPALCDCTTETCYDSETGQTLSEETECECWSYGM